MPIIERIALGNKVQPTDGKTMTVGVPFTYEGAVFVRDAGRIHSLAIGPSLSASVGGEATIAGVFKDLGRGNIVTRAIGVHDGNRFVVEGFEATVKP